MLPSDKSSDDTAGLRQWLFGAGVVVLLPVAAIVLTLLATRAVGPLLLTHYDRFPQLAHVPKRTADARGTAADPVNIALVGSAAEVAGAFQRAGWTQAVPVTRGSSVKIAESVLLNRPDSAAPVSPLYLFGREQNLAFEREVGRSARRRHHTRLWLASGLEYDKRLVWLGAATFDASAGLSKKRLRPTHHIAPDVDEERDTLAADLIRARQLSATFRVTGIGVRVSSHNADGDRFDTDGEMRVLVISPNNDSHTPPVEPPAPFFVRVKDDIWSWFHR